MGSRNIKQKLKKSLNSLNAAYHSGLISYPRVDNDFVLRPYSLDLFPHAPLKRLRYYPVKKKDNIKINKESLVLYLSILRVVTPSQVEGVFDYIDYLLDDNLIARDKEKKREAEQVKFLFDSFIEDNNLSSSGLLDLQKNFHQKAYKNGEDSYLFFQKGVTFISLNDDNRIKYEQLLKSRIQKTNNLFTNKRIETYPTITSALHAIRDENKKKLLNLEKENIMAVEKKHIRS